MSMWPKKATDPSMKSIQDLMAEAKTMEEKQALNATYRRRSHLRLKPGEYPRVLSLGSNWFTKMPMTFKAVSHHYNLIPLFILIPGACVFASGMLFRAAFFHPEVSWRAGTLHEPWNDVKPNEKRAVLFSRFDFSQIQDPRPRF